MLSYKEYRNAYIVPADMSQVHFHRGVLTEDGRIIDNSLLFEGFEPDWAGSVNLTSAKYSDETVVYIGWLEPVWGHILTDCLKKLWFLFTDDCKQILAEGGKLVAVVPWNSKALCDIFSLVGVDLLQIEKVSVLSQYKKVIIPDNSFIATDENTRTYTNEYKEIIERIINKIPETKSHGKLYFTRSAFSKQPFWRRREYGEEVLEMEFKKLGYKIVSPEKYSVIETLLMLRNCDAFATTEGSISHNVLFCKPGTPVTILRKVDYVNPWQKVCDEVSGVNVAYVKAHQSVVSFGCLGPFYMCVTRELEEYVGHRIFHVPHLFRPSFYWYLIQNRRITKRLLSYMGIK